MRHERWCVHAEVEDSPACFFFGCEAATENALAAGGVPPQPPRAAPGEGLPASRPALGGLEVDRVSVPSPDAADGAPPETPVT